MKENITIEFPKDQNFLIQKQMENKKKSLELSNKVS